MSVLRFLTEVELSESDDAAVSAVLVAVLDDGGRVVVLDDRGAWWSVHGSAPGAAVDPWVHVSREDLIQQVTAAVGPEEPEEDSSRDMVAAYWEFIAARLSESGVDTRGADLSAVASEVVLSPRVEARLPSQT